MKRTFKLIRKSTFLLLLLTVSACVPSTSQECNSGNIIVGTTTVQGPSEAAINETIIFNVSFSVDNNCGIFQSFNEEVVNANEKTVTVNIKYEGCDCNNAAITRIQPYSFIATAPGTYTLKFSVTNTTFITKIITVS